MPREHALSYNLIEIADWHESHKVSLPTVQRGFVWRPNQIENLWDSLLRGYPVGAFVLSPSGEDTYHILDGQQRATAICLGIAKETFRDSQNYYKVFIDLELPNATDSRKFVFRVITRSHPWGYRWQENNKTLTADNIRKAMDWYDVSDPLTAPLDMFFPYEAGFPVPFHFFIKEALKKEKSDVRELFTTLKQWKHWGRAMEKWLNSQPETFERTNIEAIEGNLLGKIHFIFESVCEMLDCRSGQKIPALYMNLDKMLGAELESDDAADNIENLFVRLNSGGTQLTGEELNYSILKAHLSRAVQDEIEGACKQLFKPARFITIAYRLYQQETKDIKQADALTMRIKPKQFQRTISTKIEPFEAFLLNTIRDKVYEGKTLLEYTEKTLSYESRFQPYALPFLIYSRISDAAPELIFLLLYRIKIKGDRFTNNGAIKEKEHRRMLGMLTMFLWFGRGENLKDHSKLLSNVWPAAGALETSRFWSSETVERASLNSILLPFPAYTSTGKERGLERFLDYNLTEKSNLLNRFETEVGEEYQFFLQKIIYNRELLLYAQRFFIESYFTHRQFRLEDTSIPFDWDHISPNKLVHNKRNIPRIVKDWYQTIGNFRAWPYALNRMDSDNNPCYKLNPLVRNNFESDEGYFELESKWLRFIQNNTHLITDIGQIQEKLSEWSFCEDQWMRCNPESLRTEWRVVVTVIVRRTIFVIRQWYEQLCIEELRKESRIAFQDLFDNRKWTELPLGNPDIDDLFDIDEAVNRVSRPFSVSNADLQFYVAYPDGDNGYLESGKIEFGLLELKGNNYLLKMKGKTDFDLDYDDYQWIQGNFTLISGNLPSYYNLIDEFCNWINALPVDSRDKELLLHNLREMLALKFKNRFR